MDLENTNTNTNNNDLQVINMNSINLLSVKDAIELYNTGSYVMASSIFEIISLNNNLMPDVNYNVTAYLLACGVYNFENFSSIDVDQLNTYLLKLITNNDELGNIILALWNIDTNPLNKDIVFPIKFNPLFAPQTKISANGLKILLLLSKKSKHASYLLALYYLNIGNKKDGNNYLFRSARMGHIDAQRMLNVVGVNWLDEDQCLDHINFWLLVPDCSNKHTVTEMIHSCLGCGKAIGTDLDSGDVEYNCLLCGCRSSLACSSVVDYFTDGFISCLRAIEHPLKLCTTMSSIVASALITAGISPYGEVFSFVTTGLTSLNLFINQEIQTNPDDM